MPAVRGIRAAAAAIVALAALPALVVPGRADASPMPVTSRFVAAGPVRVADTRPGQAPAGDGLEGVGLVGDPDPALTASPHLAALLPKLAKLHAGVVAMAAARGGRGPALGASQREGYVFSRRALGAVLDALRALRLVDAGGGVVDFASAPEAVVQEALDSVYLHRLRTPEDRAAVLGLMRAIGLRGASPGPRASASQAARA